MAGESQSCLRLPTLFVRGYLRSKADLLSAEANATFSPFNFHHVSVSAGN